MAQVIDERDLMTPWAVDHDDERRFKRLLLLLLLLYLLLGIIVPLITFEEIIEPPEEVPVPPPIVLEIEKVELPKPEPLPVVEQKPVEPPKVKPPEPVKPPVVTPPKQEVVQQPKAEPAPGPKVDQQVLALAALKDEMAGLRDLDTSNMGAAGGSSVTARTNRVTRATLNSGKAGQTSGGINTAAYGHASSGSGGGRTGGSTRVNSSLGAGGGGSGGGGGGSGRGSGGLAGRSEESIRRVIDRNKGKIFASYNKALRSNPALRGKFIVRMVIEPSGKVSSIKLISSQLNDSALERKLLTRVKGINFGPEDVATTKLNYTFDFLPS